MGVSDEGMNTNVVVARRAVNTFVVDCSAFVDRASAPEADLRRPGCRAGDGFDGAGQVRRLRPQGERCGGELSAVRPSDASADRGAAPASALPAVVRESGKPPSAGERPAETAYGARVVVEAKTPTADELRALIVLLARGRDPVVIDVYSSEAAYRAWKENRYKAPVAKSGFLLSYAQRNGDGQLTWMQERGHLAALFGKSESISP